MRPAITPLFSPLLGAVLAIALMPACKRADDAVGATATLRDRDGSPVGNATFEAVNGGVKLHFDGENLPPGAHGFHVHEHGRCDAPTFESAGGHFNPTDRRHGLEDPEGPHLGDLPNLEVSVDGRAAGDFMIDGATLDATGERSLLAGDGAALVIHALPDDQRTDPAGAAGERIACGVIAAARE